MFKFHFQFVSLSSGVQTRTIWSVEFVEKSITHVQSSQDTEIDMILSGYVSNLYQLFQIWYVISNILSI